MTLPAPDRHALARQVDLLRSMGGPEPIRGYSMDEKADARDRIAAVLGRVAGRAVYVGIGLTDSPAKGTRRVSTLTAA